MKVLELIELLKTFDPETIVVREIFSEQCLLTKDDFTLRPLCYPRNDGWVQNKRPDMPSKVYLVIEGN